jgi:hypothetical protein
MERIERNKKIINMFKTFDISATITNKSYGFSSRRFVVQEIVGSRVTIKHENRIIDFTIGEIDLHPISYSEKEYKQIQKLMSRLTYES